MEYGAIDLHKKESQVRIVTDRGEVLDQRIATTRDRFTAVFAGRRPMRILLEASAESEWVAHRISDRDSIRRTPSTSTSATRTDFSAGTRCGGRKESSGTGIPLLRASAAASAGTVL